MKSVAKKVFNQLRKTEEYTVWWLSFFLLVIVFYLILYVLLYYDVSVKYIFFTFLI